MDDYDDPQRRRKFHDCYGFQLDDLCDSVYEDCYYEYYYRYEVSYYWLMEIKNKKP